MSNAQRLADAGIEVKPLDWQLRAAMEGVYYHAFDPLYGRVVEAPDKATCGAIDHNRTAHILAALQVKP